MSHGEYFRRENRLRTRADFKAVYRNGVSFRRKPFLLKVMRNGLRTKRLGISISSRVVRRATGRSRIRRVLREAFRRNMASIKDNVDLVFIAKTNPGKRFGYHEAERIVHELAKAAHVLR